MNYPTIFPEISTERLSLNQLSFTDKRTVFRLRSNKQINEFLTRENPKNLNDAEGFIQTCLEGFEKQDRIFWAIRLEDSNELIGSIVFHNIDIQSSYAEFGFELNPDFQEEGYMKEAIKAVLEFGKLTMNIKTIEAFTHKDNKRSINLLEKNEFILDKDDILFENNLVFQLEKN